MIRKSASGLIFSVVSAGLICGAATVSPLSADELQGSLARGGKLYDKWFAVIKAEKPKDTHPAWPASNTKKKGNTTWRCKSCHGWDYQGKDGAYASGSYKTGIRGIAGMAGADPGKIIKVLKDDMHRLAGKMDDGDFQDLALFVSKGQVDMNKHIDRANKASKGGDAARGAGYYNTLCAQCHGKDGTQPKDMKKTLGKQMGNPWEVMHKILNGQPAEQMPALRALDARIAGDIVAHLSTLPKEK
ncbi:MAG: c-type cytochrome [Methyloligellaceae bacterium]